MLFRSEVERDIRRIFIALWSHRPITDISAGEVRAAVKRVADEGKTYQAYNLLGYARRLFNWAIDQQVYGLETSPCDRLKPRSIVGERDPRTRILSDKEIAAFWNASGELGYPYGPLYKLLVLTGQRRSEVGEARWSEFDLDKLLWRIPAARMKAGVAHIVPLCDDALDVLNSLPRFEGDYLFTTTSGKKPVNSFEKAKVRVDALMLAELRRTDLKANIPDFVVHEFAEACEQTCQQSLAFRIWSASSSSATPSRACIRFMTNTPISTKNALRLRRGRRDCARS